MNKNAIIGILSVIIIGFIGLVIAGTTADSDPAEPDSIRDAYISECNANGGMRDYCSCTYNYLVDEYGKEEFVNMAVRVYEDNEIPPAMYDAIDSCMGEL